MDVLKQDFWKQILAGIVRKIMFTFGTFLLTHGYINDSQHAGFSSLEVAQYLAGIVLVAIPVLWQWAKMRFNLKFIEAAHRASPETPLAVVKTDVLNNETKVSSI